MGVSCDLVVAFVPSGVDCANSGLNFVAREEQGVLGANWEQVQRVISNGSFFSFSFFLFFFITGVLKRVF